eukprot:1454237-Rhodomonas_salina.1
MRPPSCLACGDAAAGLPAQASALTGRALLNKDPPSHAGKPPPQTCSTRSEEQALKWGFERR